jgi:hypothetical protein
MKNDECTICIILPSGWKQTYRKVNQRDKIKDTVQAQSNNSQWTQTTNGKVRKMTAEQLLSHILPLLLEGQNRAKLQVVKNLKKV